MATPRQEKLSVFGWISYDFANTIFSMNMITFFFPLWLIDDLGCPDIYYSIVYSASMIMVALLIPFYGQSSDLSQNKKSYLIRFSLVAMVCTALIGLNAYIVEDRVLKIVLALFFIGLANFFYEGGLAFYNALLRSVSSRENVGSTSGWGVGLGYVGGIVGLLLVFPIVKGILPGIPEGRHSAFIPTAFLFFLASIPAFLLIREKTFAKIEQQRIEFTRAFKSLWDNLRQARKHKGAFRFLIANYFFEDAVVTVIIFMAVYAEKVLGFTDRVKIELFVTATSAAAVGSVLSGKLSDRLGPKRTFTIVIIGWIIVLTIFSLTTYKPLFWVLACLVGIFLGSTWTVARPLLNSLVPDEKLGLFYGLYALSGRTAAVIGPLLWGAVVTFFTVSNPVTEMVIELLKKTGTDIGPEVASTIQYRLAVISLAILMIIGLLIFIKVPDKHARKA